MLAINFPQNFRKCRNRCPIRGMAQIQIVRAYTEAMGVCAHMPNRNDTGELQSDERFGGAGFRERSAVAGKLGRPRHDQHSVRAGCLQ